MRTDNRKPIDVAVQTITVGKPTIHLSYILDSSGSMGGSKTSKYGVALDGIKNDVIEFSKSKDVDYTFTVIEFGNKIVEHFYKSTDIKAINAKLSKCKIFDELTALNDATIHTLTKLKEDIKGDEKNIVNILTDGGENASRVVDKQVVNKLVEQCKALGMTITFTGTQADVTNVIRTYGVVASNTVAYNNTAQDLARVSAMRTSSVKSYSKRMAGGASGQSLTMNFFEEEPQEKVK